MKVHSSPVVSSCLASSHAGLEPSLPMARPVPLPRPQPGSPGPGRPALPESAREAPGLGLQAPRPLLVVVGLSLAASLEAPCRPRRPRSLCAFSDRCRGRGV